MTPSAGTAVRNLVRTPRLPVSVSLAIRALTVTGRGYDQTADGVEWLIREADDLVTAVAEHPCHAGQVVAVISVLTANALHGRDDHREAACLRCDAETIVTALTTGTVQGRLTGGELHCVADDHG